MVAPSLLFQTFIQSQGKKVKRRVKSLEYQAAAHMGNDFKVDVGFQEGPPFAGR